MIWTRTVLPAGVLAERLHSAPLSRSGGDPARPRMAIQRGLLYPPSVTDMRTITKVLAGRDKTPVAAGPNKGDHPIVCQAEATGASRRFQDRWHGIPTLPSRKRARQGAREQHGAPRWFPGDVICSRTRHSAWFHLDPGR